MPSQQHTDRPGPRKQSGKPDEGDQRVLGENADQQGPRITPQDEQNTALLQHNLPRGKRGLCIWLKQVCDPQGSPEAAEEPVPEVGSWVPHQGDAALTPLCSLLTACFDQQLGSKHHCSYSAPGVGAQPKTPHRSNTSQVQWQQRIINSRVLVTGSTPMLSSPLCLRMRYTSVGV